MSELERTNGHAPEVAHQSRVSAAFAAARQRRMAGPKAMEVAADGDALTDAEMVEVLTRMRSRYSMAQPLSDLAVAAWMELLAPYSPATVVEAFERCDRARPKSLGFPPTIAEIEHVLMPPVTSAGVNW